MAISACVVTKTRGRIKDQIIAGKLIPQSHGFSTRRVPMETNYFEAYNQPNVELVDISETPIEGITQTGIKTSNTERDFAIIISATGFDASTGAFDRTDISGTHGQALKQPLGNIPRAIEYNVEWVTKFIRYATDHNITRFEPNPAGVQSWTGHVKYLTEDNYKGINLDKSGCSFCSQKEDFLLPLKNRLPLLQKRLPCLDRILTRQRHANIRHLIPQLRIEIGRFH
jgi:hypothetical protein